MGFWNKVAGVAGGVGGFVLGGPAGAAAGYGLANSLTSGDDAPTDASKRNSALIAQNGDPNAGQDAITKYTQAAISSAMPGFNAQLQGVRENAIARGASTGDLGTSYEGDLASAFQRNISNSVASHATDVYEQGQNREAGLVTGQMDRDTANQNYGRQRKAGVYGAVGSLLGGWAGGRNGGGPQGAATGAATGGTLGRAIGGY